MPNAVLRHAPHRPPPGFLRRFAGARRAATGVEFALLAPLLALGAVSLTELADRATDGRETPVMASTIGDLAAQTALQSAPAP